jgi:hypothetical protein
LGTAPKLAGGRAMVTIFDGTRQPFADAQDILITIIDGNHRVISRDFHNSASTLFTDLPIFDNQGDNYTFVAWADGYKDAGFFPVHVSAGVMQPVSLMLLPQSNAFNFAQARWDNLALRPKLKGLLAKGSVDEPAAAARYSDLEDNQDGSILACLLNITTTADQIFLPKGTVLDYFKQIIWDLDGDSHMASDRFYAWADPEIFDQLEIAKTQGKFADAPYGTHPGATRSYKQVEFGEANVQLTFHEQDSLIIDGVTCVKLESDIDYYRDMAAHLLLEVAVNAFGSLTDPRTVYVLRWIAGQRAGIPEFDPLYTIVKA